MRSTVRIDDDLMTVLRARAQAEGLSLTRMLNRLLRAGLAASLRSPEERERYEEETARMGRPRFDLDKALALAADLEDEEIIRKTAFAGSPI